MKIYQSGRESSLLEAIMAGKKTIEVRLNRDKFARYQPGDRVHLDRDIYANGRKIQRVAADVEVEVTGVQQYPSFADLMERVDYQTVVPQASSAEEAVQECYKYYSPLDEARYGVLAIHFKLIKKDSPAA